MKKRGVRDQMVIATKYKTNFHAGRGDKEIIVNFNGNGAKSLHTSVEASLKKLQTDYIDLLYVHWWDFFASIPELMQSLNHLVAARKVLYLGISDSPAWVVAKANEYARCNGLRQFSVYRAGGPRLPATLSARLSPCAALRVWGWRLGGPWAAVCSRRRSSGRRRRRRAARRSWTPATPRSRSARR